MKVRDLMTTPVKTCRTTALLGDAAQVMLDAGYGCVPVVDDEGHVKGLISIDDAIRNTGIAKGRLPSEAVMDVLRHICAPAEPEIVGRP